MSTRRFRQSILWASLASVCLMFGASAQTQGEAIFSAYEQACSGVRPQSSEDAALACIVLREDREATKADIVGFSKSLCRDLNRACESSENRNRVPRILTFGLLAGCLDPLPACGGKDDNYFASTPFAVAAPVECRALGATAAAAQLLRPRAGSGARLLMLMRGADGREISWSQEVLGFSPSKAELEIARTSMQQTCAAFASENQQQSQTNLLSKFNQWLRDAAGVFGPVDQDQVRRLQGVAGPRG